MLKFDHEYVIHSAWPVLQPMLIGSIPTSIVIWLFFYYLVKYLINSYRGADSDKLEIDPVTDNDGIDDNK